MFCFFLVWAFWPPGFSEEAKVFCESKGGDYLGITIGQRRAIICQFENSVEYYDCIPFDGKCKFYLAGREST